MRKICNLSTNFWIAPGRYDISVVFKKTLLKSNITFYRIRSPMIAPKGFLDLHNQKLNRAYWKCISNCVNISAHGAPYTPSYGVYISQLIRFARVCSHVDDFNTRNKCLTAKLLKQGYRYHKLRKAFS